MVGHPPGPWRLNTRNSDHCGVHLLFTVSLLLASISSITLLAECTHRQLEVRHRLSKLLFAQTLLKMHLLTLLAFMATVQGSPQRGGAGGLGGGAMLRFGCSQTVIDRIDPYALFFVHMGEDLTLTYIQACRSWQGPITTCSSGCRRSTSFCPQPSPRTAVSVLTRLSPRTPSMPRWP